MNVDFQKEKCMKCQYVVGIFYHPTRGAVYEMGVGCSHSPYYGMAVDRIEECPRESDDTQDNCDAWNNIVNPLMGIGILSASGIFG